MASDIGTTTAIVVGGMTTISKISKKESPLGAIVASFFLGFAVLGVEKISPESARAIAAVIITTAVIMNGDVLFRVIGNTVANPRIGVASNGGFVTPSPVVAPAKPPAKGGGGSSSF